MSDSHPLCPKCGLPAADVAEGYDPFDRPSVGLIPVKSMAVSITCTNGHRWIESQSYARSDDGDFVPTGPRRRDLCDKP